LKFYFRSDGKDGRENDDAVVDDLKKQLREKDLVLTDIRLEALSSAHQLESLKDTVIRMRVSTLSFRHFYIMVNFRCRYFMFYVLIVFFLILERTAQFETGQ